MTPCAVKLGQMAGHRASGLPCGRGERADGGEAPAGAVGEADEVLQRPVQMAADGAIQVEGDGDKGKHRASEVQRTRPEAPCSRHISPVARIEASLAAWLGEAQSATIEFPGTSPVCRPAFQGGFLLSEFWVSASRRWSRARSGFRAQRERATSL